MGFIKTAKAGGIAIDAQKAIDEGRTVFTPMLNTPRSHVGLSGGIDTWAMMIDSIEAVGWRLDQWAIGSDKDGRPQAYPLFRRV